jgi:hypothetical protein
MVSSSYFNDINSEHLKNFNPQILNDFNIMVMFMTKYIEHKVLKFSKKQPVNNYTGKC